MTTLWTMPVDEIERRRDALKKELKVHKDNDITLLDSWNTIEEAYQGNIDRYNEELQKRVDDPTGWNRDPTL